MTTWRIPTMRSREQHVAPVTIDRAPCCGVRNIGADMLRYLGDIPLELRRLAGFHDALEYACDGCMETVWREGRVGHCEWHAALGAPADHMQEIIAHMETFPYWHGTRAHALKLQHHPHLKPSSHDNNPITPKE